MDGLRDELQRLREQMQTLGAAHHTPADQNEHEQTTPPTAVTTTAIQTDETPNTTERPPENPRPRLPAEPTLRPLHHHLSSLSVDEEQPKHQVGAPRGYRQLEERERPQQHPKNTREDNRQRRRHRQAAQESESLDSESDLPRLLNSHPTQTPASWRPRDLGYWPRNGAVSPSRLRTVGSSVSASASDSVDSESESVVVDTDTEEFECPLCGGTGTFVSPSGERRHQHENKRKNRSSQTRNSYIEDMKRTRRGRSETPKKRRGRKDDVVIHTVPVYDERGEPSPIRRDRPRKHSVQQVYVHRPREGGTRRHPTIVIESNGGRVEENGGVEARPLVVRAIDREFSDDESETDSPETPRVVLRRRPRAESTPYVYFDDESSSTDSLPLVVTEGRRRKSPHVVIVDEREQPEPTVVYRRPAAVRNSVHVVRERSPSTTHIVTERPSSTSTTRIVRDRSPATTHIVRDRSPTTTHIVRDRSPATTHVVRDRQPSATRITRERPASTTHIVRDRRPSTTVITRERPTSTTHVVRDIQPSTTYIVRDRQPASTHIVRERPASTTHIVEERPATASHFILEEEEEDDDMDVEVLYRRSRVRRSSPSRYHESRVTSDVGDVVEVSPGV